MKKMTIALTILCSFQVWANQCEEERLVAKIEYQSRLKELENELSNKIPTDYNHDEFAKRKNELRNVFLMQLSPSERALYSKNFKRALNITSIKEAWEQTSVILGKYKNIDDRYLWLCDMPFVYRLPKEGILCAIFDRKELQIIPNEVMYFPIKKDTSGSAYYAPLEIYSKIKEFKKITEEEYIQRASAPYCKQTVATSARSAEQKINQKDVEKSQGSDKEK